jgi:hypothetical protein
MMSSFWLNPKASIFGSHIRGKFRDEEVRETRLHRELTHFSGK